MLRGVSKTAILTLRSRAEEHARPDRVFSDPLAAEWFLRVAWPAELDPWWDSAKARCGTAFRADDIDQIVVRYVSLVPSCSVIELGCGLSTRRSRLRNLSVEGWTDLDLPEVIELRRSWGAQGEHLACSVLNHTWMNRLENDASTYLFIAEGLLYYLPRVEVDLLFRELSRRFAGSAIIFDFVGENDYSTVLAHTASAGVPIAWKLEEGYSEVLSTFGLSPIDGMDPDRLTEEAMTRYWHRLSPKEQATIYFVMNSPVLRRGRSGSVLGRLGGDDLKKWDTESGSELRSARSGEGLLRWGGFLGSQLQFKSDVASATRKSLASLTVPKTVHGNRDRVRRVGSRSRALPAERLSPD